MTDEEWARVEPLARALRVAEAAERTLVSQQHVTDADLESWLVLILRARAERKAARFAYKQAVASVIYPEPA